MRRGLRALFLTRVPRRILRRGLAPALVFILAACAKPSTPVERGRAVYLGYSCRRCHRIGSEGGNVGPDLTFVGFRKSKAFLDLWLKDPSGWQPSTAMPGFRFDDDARSDLVEFLATLKGRDRPPGSMTGVELFERAGCVTCHGKAGAGGYPNNNVPGGKIPALTQAASGYSRPELIAKISKGVPRPQKADPTGPEPYLSMPAWGEVLRPSDIEALAEYVLTLEKGRAKQDW